MLETEFFAELNMAPVGLLSDCQYDNEYRLGVEYGDDICEFVDDKGYNCRECPKAEQKELYYPPIDDFTLLQLVIICGLPENISKTDLEQQRQDIFNHILKSDKKEEVRELLQGLIQEYSRS